MGKLKFGHRFQKFVPVAIGSGIGAGSSAFAAFCSVPTTGACIGCGSCLIPLVTLVGWAKIKSGKAN
ncbi:MAG: hypothetical protein GY786_13160 [Proteobacteria bacterium]|nr:hypothetical protein [Pseudomonadota bacterium]